METGVSGEAGLHVQKHATEDCGRELELVLTPFHNTVG